jgi:hypothetical protein
MLEVEAGAFVIGNQPVIAGGRVKLRWGQRV